MPPAATKPPTQRKRNRKRKRRAASTSSSSSSSTEDEPESQTTTKIVPDIHHPQSDDSSSSSSDSDSSELSSSSDKEGTIAEIPRGRQPQNVTPKKTPRQFSPSPPPPSAALPSFLPSENAADNAGSKEKDLKDRFRQFWMTSVADGFNDDLEEIRKVFSFLLFVYINNAPEHVNNFFFRNLTLEPRV